MNKPTLKSIARMADVSVTTVSRALRNMPDIGPETTRRIQELSRRVDYQPNELARSLLCKRTRTIGLLIPENLLAVQERLVAGIETAARERGYALLLAVSPSLEETNENIRMLQGKSVDGLIISGTYRQQHLEALWRMRERKFPFVLYGHHDPVEYDCVHSDMTAGMEAAVEHFCRLGHSRIAYLCFPKHNRQLEPRFRGYERGLLRHGLEVRDDWIAYGLGTLENGRNLMKALWQLKERPTAAVCHNDFVALGALRALHELGARAPADMALIGAANIPEGAYAVPALTTVDQDYQQICAQLMTLLLKRIEAPGRPVEKVILPTSLVVRESCGAPSRADKIKG